MKDFLYFLVGPTASGKSEVGVEAARRLGAEILSLDSMQVYRGMDIGTAKVPPERRRGVAHHLIDLLPPSASFSVAQYRREADRAVFEIRGRGKKPLFVGGTSLYLKVLTCGLFEGASMDPELRRSLHERAEREGNAALHRELAAVDPAAAARIHPNDRKRVVRALEVFRMTGSRISDLQQEWGPAAAEPTQRVVGLRLPREVLHRRIQERVEEMFARGLVEEVQGILRTGGFGPQASQALGYREILEHLQGGLALEQTMERIVKKTRAFARRQMTWLRSFPEIRWVDLEGDYDPSTIAARAAAKFG